MNPTRWFESAGSSSELVSLDRFLDPHIFVSQSGAYGGAFRVAGIDPECLSDAELANVSLRVGQAMRLLPEDCSLYQTLIKHRGCVLPPSRYADSANEAVTETQRKRHAYLMTRPLGTIELHWTICIHPPNARKRPQPGEHAAIAERLVRRVRNTLRVVSQNFTDVIGIEQLDCHAIARLYGYLANLEPELVRQRLASRDNIVRQLTRSSVRWHSEGLQIGRRNAMLFSLLQRPNATRPNLFGELVRLDANLVVVIESQRQSVVATRKCVASHQSFKDLFRHSLLSILAHAKGGKEIAKSANTVAADKGVDDLGGVVDDIENRGLTYT